MSGLAILKAAAPIVGNIAGYAWGSKDRSKARDMRRELLSDVNKSRDLGKQSIPLAEQMADYAKTVGTKEDALFRGGLAATKYRDSLARNAEARSRTAQSYGLKPGSGAYQAMTEGGTAAQRALGEAGTFNTAMNDQFDKGMDYRQSALRGIGSGQQNVTRDVESLGSLADDHDLDAAGKMQFANTIAQGVSGGASKGGGIESLLSMF